MRRGGRQRRAPALPLISLLQASSTHGARLKRKGTQNKFYNVTSWEAAVPVVGGWVGGEMITAPRLLTDLCGSELAGDISGFEPTAGGS